MRSTPRHLDEQFEKTGASGDTVRKCVAFFIAAAKDAGMPLSPHITKAKRGPRPPNSKPRKAASSGNAEIIKSDEFHADIQPSSSGKLGWSQLLLSKFPSFDPAWSPDVQAKWFDSFGKLMKADPTKSDDDDEG